MKMKSFFPALFFSLFSILSFAAIANHPAGSQKTDAEILQNVMVADSNEIAVAKLALQKTSNQTVIQFANQMIKDHSQNLQDTQALATKLNITPISSPTTVALQAKGKALMVKLTALQGKTFDKAYINAMVKQHEEVLAKLKKKMIPQASNPEILAHLKATATVVAGHLKMAKAAQKIVG